MLITQAFAQDSHNGAGETHSEVGVAENGAHGETTFPPFDPSTFPSQLLWLAITFGLFYLFLKNMVLPRIASILEVRRDRIAQDLDQAARMREEADAAVAAYEQELAEARSKAHEIGQTARDKAKAEAADERSAVEADLEAKLKKAEARIEEIKASALKEVGSIAEETTEAIVSELVGKRVAKAELVAAVKSAR